MYLRVKKTKLTDEEKKDLCLRAQKGDKEAMEALMVSLIPLARWSIKESVTPAKFMWMQRRGLYGDAVQEALCGMVDGIYRYDADKGEVVSYLVKCAEGRVIEYLRYEYKQRMMIDSRVAKKILTAMVELYGTTCPESPDPMDIADAAHVGLPTVRYYLAHCCDVGDAVGSLNAKVDFEDEGADIMDTIAAPEPEKEVTRDDVEKLIKVLPTDDQKLIRTYYGIGCTAKTLPQIIKETHSSCHKINGKRITNCLQQMRAAYD